LACLVEAETISEGWANASYRLLSAKGHRMTNLLVLVKNPMEEVLEVRRRLDNFFASHKTKGFGTVDAVADTLFPIDYYDPDEKGSEQMFYGRWNEAREFEKLGLPGGDYFTRLCRYPGSRGEVPQLERVVERLRWAGKKGIRNSNRTELGISISEELRVQDPDKDTSVMGFPCLSHISVTLAWGKVSLTATYRAQDYTLKAYGNLVGLGRLANFMATESGFEIGEVLCIASCGTLSAHNVAMVQLRSLIESCVAYLGEESSGEVVHERR